MAVVALVSVVVGLVVVVSRVVVTLLVLVITLLFESSIVVDVVAVLRVALQYCIHAHKRWRAGFINRDILYLARGRNPAPATTRS